MTTKNMFAALMTVAFLSATPLWSQVSHPTTQAAVRQGVSPMISTLFPNFQTAKIGPKGSARNLADVSLVKTTDLLNFDGLGVNPQRALDVPNTTGAAGATQYVQGAGDEFAIYDKATGALISGPLPGNTFWIGLGGPCENGPYDDGPIVQYDKLAARWVMSRSVNKGSSASNVQCVAVSTTSDATGTYYQYEFDFFKTTTIMSFTRLTVWPDAYYFWSELEDNTGDAGGWACALDRTSMLGGLTATSVCFNVDTVQLGLFVPADLDGTVPPAAGTPNFFINLNFAASSLDLYKFHVDFSNTANSTFTGPTSIHVKPWTLACKLLACITQPSPGALLDSYSLYPMYRLAYRNFGGVDTLVFNHTIDRGDGVAAIRWYQIQNLSSTPKITQQGTFASSGSAHLWIGSIAMDKNGDIALGFNLSSSTRKPSILYTGRVPSDPPGRMEPAKTIITGTGVETVIGSWGTISDMAVDPVDDCTFWYTNEYMKQDGFDSWNTRIASFRFNACQ